MTLLPKLLFAAVFPVLLAAGAQAPPAAARPSFEVASVRQNKSGGPQHSNVPLDMGNVYSTLSPSDARTSSGGYFVAVNQPFWRYIAFAYKLSGTQELALRFSYFEGLKSKAPSWVTGGFESQADRFNIEARAPANTTLDEMRLMMQSLLAERFQLVVHRESREAPAYGLVLVHPGVRGPNLQPHPVADACAVTPGVDEVATLHASSSVGELPLLCGVIAHVFIFGESGQQLWGARSSAGPAGDFAADDDGDGGDSQAGGGPNRDGGAV